MARKLDCYGLVDGTQCFVCKFTICEGCNFYKHVDDPSINWEKVNKARQADSVRFKKGKWYGNKTE